MKKSVFVRGAATAPIRKERFFRLLAPSTRRKIQAVQSPTRMRMVTQSIKVWNTLSCRSARPSGEVPLTHS